MHDRRILTGIMRNSLVRWMENSKKWLILGITLLFGGYVFIPMVRVALFFKETLPPVGFVFYLSFFQMIVLHCGVTVLLFTDILKLDAYDYWEIIRTGRKQYIVGQIGLMMGLAAGYVVLLLLLSVVITLPAAGSFRTWGRIIKTMSQNVQDLVKQSGISISYGVSRSVINRLTPVSALIFSVLFMWLTMVFLGMVRIFCTVFFSKMTGIAISGVLIAMTMFSMFLGWISLGRWLLFVSPLSWANIAVLDWERTGTMPSPSYAALFLIIGNAVMGVCAIAGFSRKDAE